MLIYEVSGLFAHKKTIKQFLQAMIKQVWGGGGGGVGVDLPLACAAIFGSVFENCHIFVSVFSIHRRPFWVDFCIYILFANICIFFLPYIIDTIITRCRIHP